MRRAWVALAVLAAAFVAALSPLGLDYGNLGCHLNAPRCDEPAWPLEALARGQVATFIHEQPLMGPASLVLRAPFAAAARIFDADLTWRYRAGLFACLLIAALLALALARRSRERGHPWIHTTVVAVLTFISPLVTSAIDAGHPEELLAAAAVVAAALLVLDARWTLAALALGVAVATKPWAVLVVLPLLLMVAKQERRRFAVIAALVVLAFYAPLAAGDTPRFGDVVQTAGSLGSHYGEATAPNAWFFTTSTGHFVWPATVRDGQVVFSDALGYKVSAGVAHLAHALVLALALGLTLAWSWRAGGQPRPETLLLLLGAILLARCALDPGNHLYYHAAAAVALLAYDALRPRARLPWLSGGFIALLWIITMIDDHLRTDTDFAWVYLAFALPVLTLVVGLALSRCRRSRSTPPTPQLPISRRHAMGSSRA